MTSTFRVYDPAECDERGVPLDWERCRTCGGSGVVMRGAPDPDCDPSHPCRTCDGHGSLKAAALDRAGYVAATEVISPYVMTIHDWRAGVTRLHIRGGDREVGPLPIRCLDCRHPMGEGTWEGDQPYFGAEASFDFAADLLRSGQDPSAFGDGNCVHYSPCDGLCRHGGPGRYERTGGGRWEEVDDVSLVDGQQALLGLGLEASWRPVDVRTLGWPHDLRTEKLAALCLRCWAERTPT